MLSSLVIVANLALSASIGIAGEIKDGSPGGDSYDVSGEDSSSAPVLAGSLKSNNCDEFAVERRVNGRVETQRVTTSTYDIYTHDVLHTRSANDCRVSILLNDGTNLSLNSNANLEVDDMVYNGPGKLGDVAVKYFDGAVDWVSGFAAKDSYEITTEMAVIGIRGTEFRIETLRPRGKDPQQKITVKHGSIFVRSRKTARSMVVYSGQTVLLSKDGSIARARPGKQRRPKKSK